MTYQAQGYKPAAIRTIIRQENPFSQVGYTFSRPPATHYLQIIFLYHHHQTNNRKSKPLKNCKPYNKQQPLQTPNHDNHYKQDLGLKCSALEDFGL